MLNPQAYARRSVTTGLLSGREKSGATMPSDFNLCESWSVAYGSLTFDDARNVDGTWYYRDPITGEIRRFEYQNRVVPLHKNPPSGS